MRRDVRTIPMSNVAPEWYQLRNALYAEEFDTAEELLRQHLNLLVAINGIGETVLHFLAVEDSLSGIEWLHARGASLDSTNEFGTPLLFEVALLGYRDLYLWLIDHGADVDQLDSNGQSISEYLAQFDKNEMIDFVNQHPKERPNKRRHGTR